MNTRYVAEFRNVEVTDEIRETERPKTSEEVVSKRGIDTKTVGKYMTGTIAITATASQLYSQYRASANAMTGNTIAQRSFDNSMAYVNEGLGLLGSVGIGLLINPVVAGGAALAYGVRMGINAYSLGLKNQVKQAQWQVESIVNQEKQNRLVQNIRGDRI